MIIRFESLQHYRQIKAFIKIAKKKNITRLDEWNPGFGALEKALKQAKK